MLQLTAGNLKQYKGSQFPTYNDLGENYQIIIEIFIFSYWLVGVVKFFYQGIYSTVIDKKMWCLDYRHIVVDMYNLYGESIKCITHAESKNE